MDPQNNELKKNCRLEELREGDKVATLGSEISKRVVPSWYDEVQFERAKQIYKDNFASVNFGHLCGLMLGLYFKKATDTLRSTGESDTKSKTFRRYQATIRHTQKWYEGDVWDSNGIAQRSLATVRSMHTNVAKKMATLNDGIVYVSQYDMARTQWAFLGPIVLFKSRVGLHDLSDEDYQALIHFWRVIGYLLGIEDKYNLCDGDYAQVVAACKSVLDEEYKVELGIADPSAVSMAKNVLSAMRLLVPVFYWGTVATYIHELVGLPSPVVTMSIVEWIHLYLMRFFMCFVLRFSIPRMILNGLVRWRLNEGDKLALDMMKKAKNNDIILRKPEAER